MIGLSGNWEEVKFVQRAVKILREGDTDDKENCWLVGWLVGLLEKKNKQNERDRLRENRTTVWSVGWRIGKLEKQID